MMVVLKHIPEDFRVVEESTAQPGKTGNFLYFKLTKRDFTTHEALKRIANDLRVPINTVSSAGNKDRRAITEQVCSVKGISEERLQKVSIDDITIDFLGYGKEPVHMGGLKGNRFVIVLRNIDKLPEKKTKFLNLFGEQRFSTNNVEIGRAIMKGDFEKAALILSKDYSKMQKFIDERNWVTALNAVPRKQLLLFVHAFQSHLWNKAAQKTDKDILPIVGFGTTQLDDITKSVLQEENVKPHDFVIRQIPSISAEGAERAVWAEAEDFTLSELEPDELHEGKSKCTLGFFLQKGCYATEFVRQLFP